MTDWLSTSWTWFERIAGERVTAIDMHTAGEPLRIILTTPWLPAGEGILARGARPRAPGTAIGVC